MLGLILAVEAYIARHDLDYMDAGKWNWKLSGRQAARKARGYDLLCFGDSMMKQGVVPKPIKTRSGWRAYNLAICAGQASATYFTLRRALESGARPSAVMVDFIPFLMERDTRFNLANWPYLVSTRECLELCRTARDAGLFAAIMSSRVFPSIRLRQEIRAHAMVALRGQVTTQRYGTLQYMRNCNVNDGAMIMQSRPDLRQDLDLWRRQFFSRSRPDPVNVSYLHRFLKLAAAHGITVYWLVPPMKPELQAKCEESGVDAQYTRFLRSVSARFPNVVVIDGRHAGYDPKVFFDPHHLGREGAYAYSVALGDVLRHHPPQGAAGPRWIDLPAYREPLADLLLEDVLQSKMVLKARLGRRRQ